MSGLIRTLLDADAARAMFSHRGAWVTAGDIRAKAEHAAPLMAETDGPVYLHASRASAFVAGLLAAAASGKRAILPAHAQPAYLAEIGCEPGALFDDAKLSATAPESGRLGESERDPPLVFFTSGSTGAPKPVEKNLSRLEIEARALEALWGARAAHVLATVSHQHIYGLLFRIMWPLMSGRTADDEAGVYWEEFAGRLGGATLISSPAHLSRLPPRADLFAEPPNLVFSSGQLLTAEAAAAGAAAFGAPVIEVLGSTETGGIAWRRQSAPDTPWTPFPGIRLSNDAEGALVVASPYLQDGAPHLTGDGAAFLPDGRFQLRPRGDRVAKVDGKRVSLARVEQALASLPEIETAYALTLPQRREALGAVVVLTQAGSDALARHGTFRLSRHLRRAAAAQLEPAERPKCWRFVDAIPTDSQGKRVLSELRALFDKADPLRPLALEVRRHTDAEAELAFTLPPELMFFDGHFPGRPILPGVAQAHMAVLIAQQLWATWPADANLARVKFRRVMTPGDHVVLKLSRNAELGRITFSYNVGDMEVSRGEIGGSR